MDGQSVLVNVGASRYKFRGETRTLLKSTCIRGGHVVRGCWPAPRASRVRQVEHGEIQVDCTRLNDNERNKCALISFLIDPYGQWVVSRILSQFQLTDPASSRQVYANTAALSLGSRQAQVMR